VRLNTEVHLGNAEIRPVRRLENAIRAVLGTEFEDEIRALSEGAAWYRPEMQESELFEFWVVDNLENIGDCSWVLNSIRPSERKYLLDQLGISGEHMRGLTLSQRGGAVLRAAGLPAAGLKSRQQWHDKWRRFSELAEIGEDEKAASNSRQSAERILRLLLYFYCSTGYSAVFHEIISDPDKLRVPKKLEKLANLQAVDAEPSIPPTLAEDGWADLGFLTIAARKMAARLIELGTKAISGRSLVLFTGEEHQSFLSLATALQPYSHDKPSVQLTRRADLAVAITDITATLMAITAREVLPRQALVLEVCSGVLGPMFRARVGEGGEVLLLNDRPPRVGDRVLFLSNADRSYARCAWASDPWADAPD
jgi:hypothetical protein